MKKLFLLSMVGLFCSFAFSQKKIPVYLDASKSINDRVEDALSRMTLEEKVALCHAQSKFSSSGVPRLGIPDLWMSDGPHGIREEVLWDEWDGANWTNDSCIAFPALTCLAASWSQSMSALYGKSIGEEARYRNKNVLLGPGVCIYRTPMNGRNFEYLGEDPYLASKMVVPYIKEVQKNGVAACVKHYALNNQEIDRDHINVVVSDRALHEIYLPAFKAAVEEGEAWSIMGSYNQYKGEQCCHNQYLLNNILKRDWKFDGVVISDWGGAHNTDQSAHNGLDLEMGTWTDGMSWNKSNAYNQYYLATPFLNKLKSGEISESVVNDKARRLLRLTFRTSMNINRPFGSFGTEEHAKAGQIIAEEGIVLLQNNKNLLPINITTTKKIVVIGENATKMMTIGGGSSSLKVKYEISPLQGLKDRIGNAAQISYMKGYSSDTLENTPSLRKEAINAAKDADIVLFFGGLNKDFKQDSEGEDRVDFNLPYGQDDLISELVKVNNNTAVILVSGNAVAMPWVKDVPAIVQAWYGGTSAGKAIASILVGDVNPSGKLPMTFPVNLKDNGAISFGTISYPGDGKNQEYKEDIYVGYRWNDKQNIKALFSFGHGLSYTKFEYGKVSINKSSMTRDGKVEVSIPIKNVGSREGKEVVQLYIHDEKCPLPRPMKELKGFSKVSLMSGEEKVVHFTIDLDALKYYDDKKKDWVADSGKFTAMVGASSDDIKDKVVFELK